MRAPPDTPTRAAREASQGQPRRDRVAGILLGLSIPLLVAGLVIPTLSLTKLMVFGETYSLIGLVFALWHQGKVALFVIILFFSIIVPSAKTLVAIAAWYYAGTDHANLHRLLRAFSSISKWSMLDVFIVALTIIILEGSLLSTTDVHPGIFLFAASVLLSSFAIHRLARASRH